MLLPVFVACQSGMREQVFNLEDTDLIMLSADSLNLSSTLLAPRKVFVLGDKIVVYEPQDSDGVLHFYDKEGNLTDKYGLEGKAANEFLAPNVYISGETLLLLSMNGRYSKVNNVDNEIEISGILDFEDKSLAAGINFLTFGGNGSAVIESASSDDMLVFIGPDNEKSAYNNYPIDLPKKNAIEI